MKQLLFILITFISLNASGQFDSKTYYKHNEIEGWIKCVETNWFIVSQQGDTTFYSQLLEDTNQDNPNEKPKYEFNGAGVRVVHDTVKVPQMVQEKTTVSIQYDSTEDFIIDPTDKTNTQRWAGAYVPKTKTITKYIKGSNRNTTKYKVYFRNGKYVRGKTRVVHHYAKPKPKPVETIKFIDYKKRLWMVVSKSGTVTMLDSSSERTALAKFKKISGTPVLSITEFHQNDIVK